MLKHPHTFKAMDENNKIANLQPKSESSEL